MTGSSAGPAGRCPTCGAPRRPTGFFLEPAHEHGPYRSQENEEIEPTGESRGSSPGDAPAEAAPDGEGGTVSTRRRRLMGVFGLAAAAGVVWAAVALTGGSREEDDGPQSVAASTTTTRPTTTTSVTSTTLLLGQMLPEPTGLGLLAFRRDGEVMLVDLDSGHVEDVARLRSATRGVYRSLVVGDRILLAEGDGLLVYPLDLAGPGVPLRRQTDLLLPSTTPGRFWVTSWDEGGGGATLEELGVDGTVHTTLHLPPYGGVRDVSEHGVLVDLGGRSYLLDPVSGRARELDGWVMAIHGARAARWACGADLRCHLEIGPLDGDGPTQVIDRVGADIQPWATTFSPDGTLLAVQVASGSGRPEMALVDVSTGAEIARTNADVPVPVAWAASGNWVFLTDSEGVRAVHRGGAPEIRLPLDGLFAHIAVIPVPRD